jgi:FkbM family methyltransferase
MLAGRRIYKILTAPFQKIHYVDLWNMYRTYPALFENVKRYVTGGGEYPYKCQVRTPCGVIAPTLFSYHDLFTVHEVFCKEVYHSDSDINVVVDLGSNIGISALYFLTRNQTSRCYLFEPDPRNVAKLERNLADYRHRIVLSDDAVADTGGVFQFGIEESGRYGGIGLEVGEQIQVNCRSINDVLANILEKENTIDLLKVDTEGAEVRTVKAIEERFLRRIRKIYFESYPDEVLHAPLFEQTLLPNDVCQLTNREPQARDTDLPNLERYAV